MILRYGSSVSNETAQRAYAFTRCGQLNLLSLEKPTSVNQI